MNGLLLTAGIGERLRPFTNYYAKPVLPVLNVPLLGYNLQWLSHFSVEHLVCNLHHLPEQIQNTSKSLIARAKTFKGNLHFTNETQLILGSGGAVFNAQSVLATQKDFIYLNGDEIILPSDLDVVRKMTDLHKDRNNFATILVQPHPDTGTKFGAVLANPEGLVHGFQRPPLPTQLNGLRPFHFTGLQIISERVFKYARSGACNIFYDIFVEAIKAGERVQVYVDHGNWYETGNPADFVKTSCSLLQALKTTEPTSLEDNPTGLTWLENTLDTYSIHPHWRNGLIAPSHELFEAAHSVGLMISGDGFSLSPESRLLFGQNSFCDGDIIVDESLIVDNLVTVRGQGRLKNVVIINPSQLPQIVDIDGDKQNELILTGH